MKKVLFCAATGLVLGVCIAAAALAQTPGAIKAGHELAQKFHSRCHAIELNGVSPHPSAPPFRSIAAKGHAGILEEALGEGIVVGPPGHASVAVRPRDAGALISYLKSLSGKG
jgi:cytochrome c5